ncbi:MAG: M67 family metallopeptidase [Lachnospiraceae bacterium]|nr:M67 family metallopeptidase [Lachnospiraceae bacterium]
MEMFKIDQMELQKIRRQAEAAYPKECCGILMENRENGQVKEIYQTGNADAVQRQMTHFLIDPLELYRAEQYAGAENMEIIGFYHSHADYPAVCSDEDKQAMIPGYIYMIVSVQRGVCAEIRVFRKVDFQGSVCEIDWES